MATKKGQGRGFAGMDPERQKTIAREGGRAAHEKGTAHEFTPDEAREAGRKGGESVSRDRAHMAQIGRRGGAASGAARRRKSTTKAPRDHANQNATNQDAND